MSDQAQYELDEQRAIRETWMRNSAAGLPAMLGRHDVPPDRRRLVRTGLRPPSHVADLPFLSPECHLRQGPGNQELKYPCFLTPDS